MVNFDKDLRSVQEARILLAEAKKAQKILASFSQEKLDSIVRHISEVSAKHAEELAKMAAEETGFGNWQDKIIKNLFASQRVYEYIKDMKTVGIIYEDTQNKILDVGVPLGVIAALIPSTNPTSTAIYKAMIAIKSGNAIVFSPHPGAIKCSRAAVEIVSKAAVEAGAPEGVIGCMETLTLQGTQELMKSRDTALILATGGEAMVRAAYSSGTPTISGGPGNAPAFIEKSADIHLAVKRILDSKTFDNGVICASEQSIVVEDCIREKVVAELKASGAYFLSTEESDKLSKLLLRPGGTINPEIVGRTAVVLAEKAGFAVPQGTRVLISPQTTVSRTNPYSREKLCPVLAFYSEPDWHTACEKCMELLHNEGQGHTLVIHSSDEAIIREFALQKPVSRVMVNTPAALGGIGGSTNIAPALTLGCGAVGGGSTSDNVSPLNLINVRKAAYGVREIEDLRTPQAQADTRFEAKDTRFEPKDTRFEPKDTRFEVPAIASERYTAAGCGTVEHDTRFLPADTRFVKEEAQQPEDTRFCQPQAKEDETKSEQIARLLGEVMKQLSAS